MLEYILVAVVGPQRTPIIERFNMRHECEKVKVFYVGTGFTNMKQIECMAVTKYEVEVYTKD